MIHSNGNNGYGNGVMTSASPTTTSLSPSSASASANGQSTQQQQGLKTYFKTPEGRYKLHSEKTHPPGILPYAHGKSVSQVGFFFSFSRFSFPFLLFGCRENEVGK